MVMKTNKLIFINATLTAFISIVVSLATFFIANSLNKTDLYDSNINKVVEIYASTDDLTSYGTGWFIDKTTIVTNCHVISYESQNQYLNYEKIQIRFADENDYTNVSLNGFDNKEDIAFLNYDGKHIHDSFSINEQYKAGDNISCLGNSNNYGLSLKKGTVSLKSVYLNYNEQYSDFFQCDISISPGDSGAPILNDSSEAIGMVTFRAKNLSGVVEQNFCYCIPCERIIKLHSKLFS